MLWTSKYTELSPRRWKKSLANKPWKSRRKSWMPLTLTVMNLLLRSIRSTWKCQKRSLMIPKMKKNLLPPKTSLILLHPWSRRTVMSSGRYTDISKCWKHSRTCIKKLKLKAIGTWKSGQWKFKSVSRTERIWLERKMNNLEQDLKMRKSLSRDKCRPIKSNLLRSKNSRA